MPPKEVAAEVNRDLAALKHILHKAEIWGYVEISPGRRVENLRDDGSIRTDYYTEEQLTIGRSQSEAYFWSAPGPEGCGHGGDPRFARTSQRHADRKALRASGAEQSRFSGAASQQKGKFITQIITQNGFCTIFGYEER